VKAYEKTEAQKVSVFISSYKIKMLSVKKNTLTRGEELDIIMEHDCKEIRFTERW
jgi:hypothetical protein